MHKVLLCLFAGLLCCTTVYAQQIHGTVLDAETHQPVPFAAVTSSTDRNLTDTLGKFTIKIRQPDTLKITATGYIELKIPAYLSAQNIQLVLLKDRYQLQEVKIIAQRNRVKDSVNLRREYAKVFNYKPYKITDAFGRPSFDAPFAFMSINLGILYSALNKKHDPTYRLQQTLIRDERAEYVNARYNAKMIARITGLNNDSLESFRVKYFPAYDWLKQKSDYDLIMYIKDRLKDFTQPDTKLIKP